MSQSIGTNCNDLKIEYDKCFNKWYSEKFLKGDVRPECKELFEAYRACVLDAVKKKKIDKIISDARKDDPFPAAANSPSSPLEDINKHYHHE
ncbi:5993_t:CDS:2 [Ambispora gerdemannii]|uniref:5993_t:CDS:1 n=1 Tax=Ambispora gerdemannii TaxID=144530 RepID=A0A9N8YJ81_9GLOM|nr:5993_t:CDS:2 [Ambispora gerdemannii]